MASNEFTRVKPTTCVRILLRMCPQQFAAPAPLAFGTSRPTVCVMGLHRSGTHLLLEYLSKFFHVDVEPKKRRMPRGGHYDDGTVILDDYKIWKHTVPLETFNLPERTG